MSWFDWLLIGWWLLGTVVTVALIGRPRKPLEPSTAAIIVLINAAFITGLLVTRGAL